MMMTIEIDKSLLQKVMKITDTKTHSEAVDYALRLVVRQAHLEILNFRGKLEWEGDLDSMRTD